MRMTCMSDTTSIMRVFVSDAQNEIIRTSFAAVGSFLSVRGIEPPQARCPLGGHGQESKRHIWSRPKPNAGDIEENDHSDGEVENCTGQRGRPAQRNEETLESRRH